MKTIARLDASSQGLTRYFTGKPCKNGHVLERMVANGTCVKCLVDKRKRPSRQEAFRRAARKQIAKVYLDPEKIKEYNEKKILHSIFYG